MKLTTEEELECFAKAHDQLNTQEKYVLGRTRNRLIESIGDKCGKKNIGIGREGSLELLAKLGMWIVEHDGGKK